MFKTIGFFIAGTSTGVGKTLWSLLFLEHLKQQGYKTIGFKPIAAGCKKTSEGFRNDDALALQKAASISLPYSLINPFAWPDPVSPHIASARANQSIKSDDIQTHFSQLLTYHADFIIVEGAGGWHAPINQQETMADIAIALQLPVILVVGITLGCLNHALLTYEAILASGLPLVGWVANCIDENALCVKENIDYLETHFPMKKIATLPYSQGEIKTANKKPFEVQ